MGLFNRLTKIPNIRLKYLQVASFADYGFNDIGKSSYYKLCDKKTTVVYPIVFVDQLPRKGFDYITHEKYLSVVKNARVIGISNVVIVKNFLLYDALKEGKYRITDPGLLRHNHCPEEKIRPFNLGNKYIAKYYDYGKHIKEGITLIVNCSWNYYHYIYELIQKFYLIETARIPEDIPLIVDSVVREIPQFSELLSVFRGRREIIYIDKLESCKVDKLYYLSFVHQIPINFWDINNVVSEDVYFDGDGLLYLRENFLNYANANSHAEDFPEKIIISRRISRHRSYNEDDIIDIAKENGYSVVYPEEMSVKEQFQLFSNVDSIIAASGAALSNIICCKKHCKILVLVSNRWDLTIFSNIAGLVGADMKYLCGVPNNPNNVQSGFTIDKEYFKDIINQI